MDSQASGTNSNANSISSNKDVAKKSRYGTQSTVFGAGVKKTESVKKISSKSPRQFEWLLTDGCLRCWWCIE